MKYCVMVTLHGVHEFDLDAGAPDTGGQNVFVNQMARELVGMEWDVTIVNRGGYPHPRTGVTRRGTLPGPPPAGDRLRTVLIEDGMPRFVRKEEMGPNVPALADSLADILKEMTDAGRTPSLVISHYWDGGSVTAAALERLYRRGREGVDAGDRPIHAWIPHSLGAVKRRNMAPEYWGALGLDEREEWERHLLDHVGIVGTTSAAIHRSLVTDYSYAGPTVFLPPCIDPERFYPGTGGVEPQVARLLEVHSSRSADEISSMRIMSEISRTDRTKRKDIVLAVTAALAEEFPDLFLAITVDSRQEDLATELLRLIATYRIEDRVAVLGNIAPAVPALLRSSYLYITPSEMEGFGMSMQEAAACGVPSVASDLVPFATEFLLGSSRKTGEEHRAGVVVVPHGKTAAFTEAVRSLYTDRSRRDCLGRAAREITIPDFTWKRMLARFLDRIPDGGSP
jgi:mannosylfructose-phosphate synthase